MLKTKKIESTFIGYEIIITLLQTISGIALDLFSVKNYYSGGFHT